MQRRSEMGRPPKTLRLHFCPIVPNAVTPGYEPLQHRVGDARAPPRPLIGQDWEDGWGKGKG